jgi:GDP-4-dehydro-6-deoxy-D-mannose reductase
VTAQTIVITGVDGFVGRHTARAVAAAGHRVVGLGRATDAPDELRDTLDDYVAGDLTQGWPFEGHADAVIHLAGLAAVGPSFDAPQQYVTANSAMVTSMCESLIRRPSERPVRVVGVSTGAVYRAPEAGEALDETAPVAESSPYVVSKLLVEHQLAYYSRRGVDAVVARPFNHIGPGQSGGFLVPDLTRRLLDSDARTITTGNLETRRDYTDVRDVARAYVLLATAADHQHDVYNVASGTARSGAEVLEAVCSALGRPVPETDADPDLIRPNDPPVICGDAARLRDEFGWEPTYEFARTVDDYVHEHGTRTPSVR